MQSGEKVPLQKGCWTQLRFSHCKCRNTEKLSVKESQHLFVGRSLYKVASFIHFTFTFLQWDNLEPMDSCLLSSTKSINTNSQNGKITLYNCHIKINTGSSCNGSRMFFRTSFSSGKNNRMWVLLLRKLWLFFQMK